MAWGTSFLFCDEDTLSDAMSDWSNFKSILSSDINFFTFINVSVSLFLLYISCLLKK